MNRFYLWVWGIQALKTNYNVATMLYIIYIPVILKLLLPVDAQPFNKSAVINAADHFANCRKTINELVSNGNRNFISRKSY